MIKYNVTVDNERSYDVLMNPEFEDMYIEYMNEMCGMHIELTPSGEDNTYDNGVTFIDRSLDEEPVKVLPPDEIMAIELEIMADGGHGVVNDDGLFFDAYQLQPL